MSWYKVKVGDFLIRVKNLITIEKDKEYSLVTIKLYHKGVQLRKKELGANISADKMSRIKAGQFILSGIDARNGAFGIVPPELDGAVVTNDFWHFELDESIISKEYFLWLTSTPYFDDICNKASDGTTNRIRLQSDRFYTQELFIPEIENQHAVVEELKKQSNKITSLQDEYRLQFTQLDNLNQVILQEAVQGKLVAQNPDDEPASELLKRIKAEKALSNKKQKPLPPIKPEEIPFDIPESWVWCRLGEMFDIERGSSPRPKGDPRYFSKSKTPFHWITISDMTSFAQDKPLSDTREYLTELGTKHSRYVSAKDIIIVASGNAGRASLLGIEGYIYDGLMSIKNIPDESMKYFLFYLFKIFEANMMKLATGATWQNINTDILKNQPIPIPPLSEQKRIVTEIEKQFAKTKQLKEHIIANEQATEQLLKALLHQAFEVKDENTETIHQVKGKVVELKPTNVDYYRRTVLSAEIVWQLHKEPTLGHLKLQKLIYLCQQSAEMQLPTNFLRQAMGPYDNRLMRSIDKQLKEKKWFEYNKTQVLKYQPLEKAGQHHNDFVKYFSAENESIQFIIDTFKTIKSDIVEIVATLYSCINNIIDEKVIFSETLLIQRFYEWSEEKQKFSEKEVKRVFSRMKETGILPKGFTI